MDGGGDGQIGWVWGWSGLAISGGQISDWWWWPDRPLCWRGGFWVFVDR